MPFTVRDLVGDQELIKVAPDDPVQKALNRMLEHDFSQLPVVDGDGRFVGLITSESILRAIYNFQATTNPLPVYEAVISITYVDKYTYPLDDDPFWLLDSLKSANAVVIVDNNKHPVGIVTNADMAEWFRQRAQDNMFAADIENRLKDYIGL